METKRRGKFDPHTQAIIDLTNAIHSWRDEARYPRRWYHPLVNSGLFKIMVFAALGGGIGGCVGYLVSSAVFAVVTSAR